MDQQIVTIHVLIGAADLRRFAFFDTFYLKRRYRAPALFALILCAFALAAYLSGRAQASLITTLLLVIGLGLPLVYVLHFLLQLHDQSRRLGLKKPRPAYTLNLGHDVRIINDMKNEAQLTLPWDALHGVWRAKGAYYLYAGPSRAFILPDSQLPLSPAAFWDFLFARLPEGKLHGRKP